MHSLQSHRTRARNNSLKQSTRVRPCPPYPLPPLRKIKPVPTPIPITQDPSIPMFPIPGVILHPDDASNRVLHAIGRSFLSVENRAMTIKDLAEMTLKYGLMCQNVSAASQAITTYIRNHMARCDSQQDHPLLLRHILSGTLADDDLVPALHSRAGGAANPTKSNFKDPAVQGRNFSQDLQDTLEGERLTNFRRGTMVWYLSKATGASCPFARAGIRLCEYGKEGRKVAEKHVDELHVGQKRHAIRDEAQVGEKRKRLRRGCRRDSDTSRTSSSPGRDTQSPAIDGGYGELSTGSIDNERPPKVKLTLRLRPSLLCVSTPVIVSRPREVIDLSNNVSDSSSEDDADDSDDVGMRPGTPEVPWSLPPYPRRAISVPCYTPNYDECAHSSSAGAQCRGPVDERKRSPSVPWSASPPPDSDRDDLDLDLDSDVDWDSSFSVPSPAPVIEVKVETVDDLEPLKHEPTDIRHMLDAWEDLDCALTSTVSSATVKLPASDDLKFDEPELWEWEFEGGWSGTPEDQQELPILKTEPDGHGSPFLPDFPFSSSPLTSSSQFSPNSDPGVVFPACQSPLPLLPLPTSRSTPSLPTGIGGSALTWQDAELLGPDSVHLHEFEDGWATRVRMHVDCDLLPQRALGEVASFSPHAEPKQDKSDIARTRETNTGHNESGVCPSRPSSSAVVPDVVVVRTCRPCTPDVCATQVEGISVYQTTLGLTLLLRRIDTDFVNLSTILSHLSLPPPSPLPNACVDVSHPCLSISGIWAPLSVARLYAHGLPPGIESIFLSDDLVVRFPTALQDFHQKSISWRLLNQFGPNFSTSLSSPCVRKSLSIPQLDHEMSVKEGIWHVPIEVGPVEEPLLTIPPSVNLALANLHPPTSTELVHGLSEMPLSPTEQEMFRVLCVHPDWETENVGANEEEADTARKPSRVKERPLRRSRRVADAIAARSLVVSPRAKGPRHS